MDNRKTLQYESKIVVIGYSSVGKSTFLHHFMTGEFSNKISTTFGTGFHQKILQVEPYVYNTEVQHAKYVREKNYDRCKVKLFIWDTAGQERFRSITSMYQRNAHAAVVMFAKDSHRSWREVQRWVSELKENAPEDMLIVIVGNKCDLQPEVDDNEVTQFCEQQGFHQIAGSALTGVNVNAVFEQLANSIFLRNLRNDIMNVNDNNDHIPRDNIRVNHGKGSGCNC